MNISTIRDALLSAEAEYVIMEFRDTTGSKFPMLLENLVKYLVIVIDDAHKITPCSSCKHYSSYSGIPLPRKPSARCTSQNVPVHIVSGVQPFCEDIREDNKNCPHFES